MNEYEVLVERIDPCGGEKHSHRELIDVEAESPEAYIRDNAQYPVVDDLVNAAGDRVFVTADGKGNMVRFTFTHE